MNQAETFEWMRQRITDLERELAALRSSAAPFYQMAQEIPSHWEGAFIGIEPTAIKVFGGQGNLKGFRQVVLRGLPQIGTSAWRNLADAYTAALGEQPTTPVVAPSLPEGYPEWFQRVYGYACTQTRCIIALSRCTPQDYYHLVNAALRELNCELGEQRKAGDDD